MNPALCVVCPPGDGECYEGPCATAPAGMVVASATASEEPDWVSAAAAASVVGLLVAGVSLHVRGKPVIRQSRPRR